MWLRDLSLAWRPKSLSGLPLAMENCLRHFPSTFAPYESCIRHSTLLDKIVLFSCLFPFFSSKPCWWLFNLAHRLPPERFCEVYKHSGGQVLQQVFLLKAGWGGAGVWCSLCEEMTSSILLLHSQPLDCCSGKAWRLTLWFHVCSCECGCWAAMC